MDEIPWRIKHIRCISVNEFRPAGNSKTSTCSKSTRLLLPNLLLW